MASWLESPSLDRSSAAGLVADAVVGEDNPSFRRYLEVLAANDRLALLPEISQAFSRLREAAEQRLKVRVVSAVPLEQDEAERAEDSPPSQRASPNSPRVTLRRPAATAAS